MPRIHSHVPGEGSPFGSAGQHAVYRRAAGLYRQDKIEPAFQAMLELGTGSFGEAIPLYRMIEAEYLTRQKAVLEDLSPVLRVEFVDRTVHRETLVQSLLSAREQTAERLGIDWDSVVHVTILDESVNAPWAPGRHGYCSPKEGFSKICLPHYLTEDPDELVAALRHELTHALVFQEADEACAEWLHEAAAMQIGGEPIEPAAGFFRSHPHAWMEPESLSAAFNAPRISRQEQERATTAYWQAALIGAYLASLGGEALIGRLLKGHRLGFAEQLKSAFLGASPSSLAVEKLLNTTVADLFKAARKWCLDP